MNKTKLKSVQRKSAKPVKRSKKRRRKRRKPRFTMSKLLKSTRKHTTRTWRRIGRPRWRRFQRTRYWHLWKMVFCVSLFLLGATAINFAIHLAQKPTDVLSSLETTLPRLPGDTWSLYANDFCDHQTDLVPASLLASIAQSESGGRSWVSAPWQWQWRMAPYGPPSSAAGLMQFTSETFRRFQHLCVRNGRIETSGAWHDLSACWFTDWRTRMSASDAIEVAAIYLHTSMQSLWASPETVPLRQRVRAGGLIHLCGPGGASKYLKSGNVDFTCGSHSARVYLARIEQFHDFFRKQKPCSP